MPSLYNVIKSSYSSKDKQKKKLAKDGFIRDDKLSNHNEQVYYNPKNKQMIYSVAGTHNLQDIGTDIYLAFGGLKNTNRYKEADKILKEAKEKYKPNETTVTGHSLGGSIAGYVSSKNDKVFTLDKGATLYQKVRGNEKAYRTEGDLVSLLDAGAKHTINLENPNKTSHNPITNMLNAHNVDNIKDSAIFV